MRRRGGKRNDSCAATLRRGGPKLFFLESQGRKYLSRRDAVTLSEEQEKIPVLPRCAKAGSILFLQEPEKKKTISRGGAAAPRKERGRSRAEMRRKKNDKR